MKLLIIIASLIYSDSFAQTSNYQSLIDTVFKRDRCMFFHTLPLKITRLDPPQMRYYVENVWEYSNKKLDTLMFAQIIQNSRLMDTTEWTDNELPNYILVSERSELVSKRIIPKKFSLSSKIEIRQLRKYITRFNSTKVSDRVICYYSRPVFDNSKTFAIVEWDNGHGYLGGGGGIILYQLQTDNSWKEFGTILNWRY